MRIDLLTKEIVPGTDRPEGEPTFDNIDGEVIYVCGKCRMRSALRRLFERGWSGFLLLMDNSNDRRREIILAVPERFPDDTHRDHW
jgi:hypothetical protein